MLRQALVEPIAEIFEAAALLMRAVEAHSSDDARLARKLILQADMRQIRDYTEQAWGAGSKARFRFVTAINAPPKMLFQDRLRPRMPTQSTRCVVMDRDGYHCRFCGTPVVSPIIRRAIANAYPEALSWGSSNVTQHAAFQCMWLQFNHILPSSRGGSSDAENVVITCAPCNFGRMEATLAEAQLADPLSHPTPKLWGRFDEWNGLADFAATGA